MVYTIYSHESTHWKPNDDNNLSICGDADASFTRRALQGKFDGTTRCSGEYIRRHLKININIFLMNRQNTHLT